ncbi:hypothetical protein NUW54_g13965 [Trametes sanguinea]|uniref:Uncharacterized protein n=1 Tax=Trametes sanguinea TaxID=158606 RepID=A0ACC1MGH7_9APHY|nr:hypothetical protein NUW54_g13965 [Trametes sanguinea]
MCVYPIHLPIKLAASPPDLSPRPISRGPYTQQHLPAYAARPRACSLGCGSPPRSPADLWERGIVRTDLALPQFSLVTTPLALQGTGRYRS